MPRNRDSMPVNTLRQAYICVSLQPFRPQTTERDQHSRLNQARSAIWCFPNQRLFATACLRPCLQT